VFILPYGIKAQQAAAAARYNSLLHMLIINNKGSIYNILIRHMRRKCAVSAGFLGMKE